MRLQDQTDTLRKKGGKVAVWFVTYCLCLQTDTHNCRQGSSSRQLSFACHFLFVFCGHHFFDVPPQQTLVCVCVCVCVCVSRNAIITKEEVRLERILPHPLSIDLSFDKLNLCKLFVLFIHSLFLFFVGAHSHSVWLQCMFNFHKVTIFLAATNFCVRVRWWMTVAGLKLSVADWKTGSRTKLFFSKLRFI